MFAINHITDLQRRDGVLHAAGLGATVLIAAAVYLLAELPLQRRQAALERTARACEGFLSRGDEIRREHQDLQARLTAVESTMTGLLQRIPERPQEGEFLAELATLANQTGFVIHDYRPGEVRPQERHSELEIHLQAEGTYESTCRFLQGLEGLNRLCRLTNWGTTLRPDSSMPITSQLTLQIFFTSAQHEQVNAERLDIR